MKFAADNSRYVIIALPALLLFGCMLAHSDVALSPSANLASLRSIAVWKFRDGGRVSNSGDIATRAIESALLTRGFRLVAYSKIRHVISVEMGSKEGLALDAGMLTPSVLAKIRGEAGVQAIIVGSVSNAWCRWDTIPSCRIEASFQMIDTESGEIIVTANASDYAWSLQSAAQQMAEEAIAKLKK